MTKDVHEELSQRITRAFPKPLNQAQVDLYVSTLRDNWRDTESSFTRSVAIVFLLSIVYMLVVLKIVTKIDAGAVEIDNLALIQYVVPTVIAYYIYDAANLAAKRGDLRAAYFLVLNVVYPDITKNSLEVYLAPNMSSLYGSNLIEKPRGRLASFVIGLGGAVVSFFFLSGTFAFGVIAVFINIFGLAPSSGVELVALVVSSVATLLLVVQALFVLAATPGADHPVALSGLERKT
jgi:hypothetical protein